MSTRGRGEVPADLLKLVEDTHYAAVGASPLFSVEHWKHNAGPDWPEQPDDDSFNAFENCQHPTCKWARSAVGGRPQPEALTDRG